MSLTACGGGGEKADGGSAPKGGVVSMDAWGEIEFHDCLITDNRAQKGAGIYMHVGCVCSVTDTVVENNKGEAVFNLGTGTGYSVLDMVKAFEEANGVAVPYKIVDRRPGDLATCYADPAKSAEKLGWKAEKTLADMCRDAWNWQKKPVPVLKD